MSGAVQVSRVDGLARVVLDNPSRRNAVRLAKQGLRSPDEAAYEAGVRGVLSGADFAEATQAALEKRKPRFTGA